MKVFQSGFFKRVAVTAAVALALPLAQVPMTASADTAPPNPASPTTPVTVSADPLPTVQIDGVAWTQYIIGNTVYVGGKFTTARPAGAAAGVSTTPRANLLAYNLTTGELITTWSADTNGEVFSITASPDKSVLYVGGSFTTVKGITRNRIVALNPATGAVIQSFQAGADSSVRAIVATAGTVYFGGVFTSVTSRSAAGTVTAQRNRLAAVQAADGAILSWAPAATSAPAANGTVVSAQVSTMAISPAGDKILVGGKFTALNGSSSPGYGLGAIDLSGNLLPWAGNTNKGETSLFTTVRNGGNDAGITSLRTDGDSVFVTGYVFGAGGNLESLAKMKWSDGSIEMLADCHGDTYESFPMPGSNVVYAVSHAHYCGNLPDGFGQTNPRTSWTMHWATAFTKTPTQTLTKDQVGYPNWTGMPAPSLLKWLPRLEKGSFTGQGQAGWTVTGNDQYVVYGGEFPRVAGSTTTQQGLVRYAVSSIAPDKVGPELTGSKINPTLTSVRPGEVRISWPANWDRDNEQLTYKLVRDSVTTKPIFTTTALSSEWDRPSLGYVDSGLTPGQSYRYRLYVTDPFGNQATSDTVTIVAASTNAVTAYGAGVLADGASSYWPLGEASGSTAVDLGPSFSNATVQAGVTRGAAGAIAGSTDTATTFGGTDTGWATTSSFLTAAPASFSTEAWIKTTSTSGGKIIGFGSNAVGPSYSYDRHTYMTTTGKLVFGVYAGSLTNRQTITSPASYNDGTWHHVVSTLGSTGMRLYVDGVQVASNTTVTSAYDYRGYWRLGGDNLTSWPNDPTSDYLAGSIDEAAVYPSALTATQVAEHRTRATGGAANIAPTAAFTSTVNKLAASFDASGSTDADGTIASYAWDFGDGTTGTGQTATRTYAAAGSYTVTLTVTDNQGATSTKTATVVASSNAAPTAAFTSSVSDQLVSFDASGSTDSDGTIASYAWDFGDGTTGTGKTTTRTYAAPGTYSVTLTVTDNDGSTATSTQSVTATAQTGPLASDDFARTVSGGWGSATKGGAWTRNGTSTLFAVDGSAGKITMSAAGSGPRATLAGVSTTSSDVSVEVGVDKLPSGATGSTPYTFVGVSGRTVGTDEYRAKLRISNTGSTMLYLTKLVGSTETTLTSLSLGSSLSYTAGSQMQIRLQVTGTGTSTIRAKVWKVGATEPAAWTSSTTDTAASLQTAGGVGLLTYLHSSATNVPVVASFDDLVVNAGP